MALLSKLASQRAAGGRFVFLELPATCRRLAFGDRAQRKDVAVGTICVAESQRFHTRVAAVSNLHHTPLGFALPSDLGNRYKIVYSLSTRQTPPVNASSGSPRHEEER